MNSHRLMMNAVSVLATLLGYAALAAEPAATAPAANTPTANAVSSPAVAGTKTPAASAPAADDDQASIKAAQQLGLKPKKRGNTMVYCRTEASVGSRFETTTCYSKDQLVALAERSRGNREAVEDARKRGLAEHASN